MKVLFRIFTIHLMFVFFLLSSLGFAAEKKQYPASPPEKISKKWRIAYLEGGPYQDYQETLIVTIEGLAELGWIEKIKIPPQKDESDTAQLWAWLAENTKSRYLEFVKHAYYSNNWDDKLREKNRELILSRLNKDKDIDLMLALGTQAGQDLANNRHSIPTVVASTSDALRAKIIKSIEDSGYDHVHALIDPTRYERQIRAFHDVIGFKRLAMAFQDTLAGRSYAALEDVEKVAKEREFEIVKCYIRDEDVPAQVSESDMIKCAQKLAPKTDAFYITGNNGISENSLPHILAATNAYNIAVFSQPGITEVRRGALLSVAPPDLTDIGKFHAEVIGKIINGAKPRDLNQKYKYPIKLAFNAEAAMIIGLDPDIFEFLSNTAELVYEKIEK